MNILIEGGDLNPPFYEGTRNTAISYAKALKKQGHKAIIFTKNKDIILNKTHPKKERIEGIKYYRWKNKLDFFITLRKIIKKEKINAINILIKGSRPSYYLRILRMIKPVYFIELGWPYTDGNKEIKKFKSFKIPNKIICTSLTVKNELKKILPNKIIKHIYYGIDHEKFNPGNKKRKDIICLRKITPELIKAFKRLHKEDPSLKLIVNKRDWNEDYPFLEYTKPTKNPKERYQKAKVVLELQPENKLLKCASPPAILLEAMSCGCTLVVSNTPELTEVINNKNGFIVRTNNEEDLYQTLKKALKDKTKGKAGRKTVLEKFNWETLIPEYINTFKNK